MNDLEEKILKDFHKNFQPNKKYKLSDIQCDCGQIIKAMPYKKDWSKVEAFLKKAIKDIREETLREVLRYQGEDMIDIVSSKSRTEELLDKLKGAR